MRFLYLLGAPVVAFVFVAGIALITASARNSRCRICDDTGAVYVETFTGDIHIARCPRCHPVRKVTQ